MTMNYNIFFSLALSRTDLHDVSTRRRVYTVYLIPIYYTFMLYDVNTLAYIFYSMITPGQRSHVRGRQLSKQIKNVIYLLTLVEGCGIVRPLLGEHTYTQPR